MLKNNPVRISIALLTAFLTISLAACVTWTPEMVQKKCDSAKEAEKDYMQCVADSAKDHKATGEGLPREALLSVVLKECGSFLSLYGSSHFICIRHEHAISGEEQDAEFMTAFNQSQDDDKRLFERAKKAAIAKLK